MLGKGWRIPMIVTASPVTIFPTSGDTNTRTKRAAHTPPVGR
jgi:hypothetical protein